ncbi:MAG TPA: Ig-like domain-containing protein [Candidatus Methanoperedens sp.]
MVERRIIQNIMAVLVVFAMLVSVASAADTVVSIENATVAKTGDTATVKIRIDNVTNLGGAAFLLDYDPDIVSVAKVSDGDLGKINSLIFRNITVLFWTSNIAKNGSFVFAQLTLKAEGAAGQESDLLFKDAVLTETNIYKQLNFTVRNGTFKILTPQNSTIVLSPATAANKVNTSHTVTATVKNESGVPIANREVTFTIVSGPNAKKTEKQNTDVNGTAIFTYTGMTKGKDVIEASFMDMNNKTIKSNKVTKEWTEVAQSTIVLSPESAANKVNTSHAVTATVKDESGKPIADREVTFTIVSGPNSNKTEKNNTDANGVATFTYTGMTKGKDVIEASFMDMNNKTIKSNKVTKEWEIEGIQSTIVLSPASATNNVNTSHTVIATVEERSGAPIANREVTFTIVSGPNSPKTEKHNTNANGTATFTYKGMTKGTDVIEASFVDMDKTIKSDQVTKEWTEVGPKPTIPEFGSVIVPIVSIVALMLLLFRRKEE